MTTDSIEKLYKNFGVLADAKDKIQEHSKEYLEILAAVKGTEKEKRLASQFITRFFKHFPSHCEGAIEALLDLCEDEEVSIRKQAIKDLPSLCKDNGHYTQKIADILAQLLQAEDASELAVVNNSLMTLLSLDPKGCLAGVFSQILSGEDFVREKCIKFLALKVRKLGKDILNKDAEDFVVCEIKKVLQDVNAYEFNVLMDLLGTTRLVNSVTGHQELVDLICEQAEIDQPFSPTSGEETSELLDRLINCVKHALPYFSNQVPSTRLVNYICMELLPQLDKIFPTEDSPIELELLKVFAELTSHCGPLTDAEKKVDAVFGKLLKYMPLPPEDITEMAIEPRLEFSYVECLLYTFHRLARQCPEYVIVPDRLKDFKIRLQYFARGIQGYIKKLREALAGKTAEELKSDENKLKVVALKTTSNINILIKDLFHSPPSFKSVISLSWKPLGASPKRLLGKESEPEGGTGAGAKRHTPITFGDAKPSKQKKASKDAKELYSPPSGKYSNKVSSYGRGGSRGRGPRGRYRSGGRAWYRPY